MAIKFWQVEEVFLTAAAIVLAQSMVGAEPLHTPKIQVVTAPPNMTHLVSTKNQRPQPQQIVFSSPPPAHRILSSTFGQLLNPAPSNNLPSAIPRHTKLLSLTVRPAGIYVDLSREFLQGGGSASMISRLTQVVHTATSLDPHASVYLSIDGQPLSESTPLAGEGLLVRYPTDRQQLAQDFPLY
jgi:spore germination protein GerM